MRLHPSSQEIVRLQNCALGREKADLLIQGGTVVDVYTGELLPNYSVAVKGERIAYVGEEAKALTGPETLVVDARGKFIAPGFIDGHVHLIYFVAPDQFLKYSLPGGTTAMVTETLEVAFPLGLSGVLDYLASLEDQPAKLFATAPVTVSPSPAAAHRGLTAREVRRLLAHPLVVGLGETYWADALNGSPRLLSLFEEAHQAGKVLEGHTAGAKGNKLQAYLAAGFSSCHEPITAPEVIALARLGVWVILREGSIRRELEAVVPALREAGIDFRRLCLGTDGLEPADLMKQGHMDFVVQKAIDLGLPPVRAFQMATINTAEHFHLEGAIGGIAPGKFADLVVLPSLTSVRPEYVISSGRVVAEGGRLLASPRRHRYPGRFSRFPSLPHPLSSEDFAIKTSIAEGKVMVRVIEMVTDLVTQEGQATLPVSGGTLPAGEGMAKAAVVERLVQPGKTFIGLVRGSGLRRGAFATTTGWESTALLVVGASDTDMALAANRVMELGGGSVVAAGGRMIAELPLPLGGLLTGAPIEEVAARMERVNASLRSLGMTSASPHLTLAILTTGAIPYLRLTEEGYFSLRDGKGMGLVVE